MLGIGVFFDFICFLFSFVSRKRKAEAKKTKSVFIDDEASEHDEDNSEVDEESATESVEVEVVYRFVVSCIGLLFSSITSLLARKRQRQRQGRR